MGYFHHYVEAQRQRGLLILQPRMGFSDMRRMRAGLIAVRQLEGARIGTLTLDSLTRQGLLDMAAAALAAGCELNGYPLLTYGASATRAMLDDLHTPDFAIQVRHGTPLPDEIFRMAAACGLEAIEGGPVSYCLPYGRTPLRESIASWSRSIEFWADEGARTGRIPHVESFAGCMLGQLCPPSLLVALSILEGLFFVERGISSLSLSYAQGTNPLQDEGALMALRALAERYLPSHARWHLVLYTWMGVFPSTVDGAEALIAESARIAVRARVERIIVKTTVEASHLPSIADNIAALQRVRQTADATPAGSPARATIAHCDEISKEACAIVDAVCAARPSLDAAIMHAFQTGLLDVPYCLHPDNRNEARACIDAETGVIGWAWPGRLPVAHRPRRGGPPRVDAAMFLSSLRFNSHKYDQVPHEA